MPYLVKGKFAVGVDGERFPPGVHDDPLLEKGITLFPHLVERISDADAEKIRKEMKAKATTDSTPPAFKPPEDETTSEGARGKGK
jgi:hypothetical protein